MWIFFEELIQKTCLGFDFKHWEGFEMLKVYKYINNYKIINNRQKNNLAFLHFAIWILLEKLIQQIVSELILDTGKALKGWFEWVFNKWIIKKKTN